MKIGILNYTKFELNELLNQLGIPKYRTEQIFQWIYRFGKISFDEMSNISKTHKAILNDMFYIYRPHIVKKTESVDGTIKFLLKLQDGNTIETVFIPEIKRNTICVSSQVGCAVGCKFCNTGYNGFIRNLTVEEIVSQFLVVKDYLNIWEDNKRLSNVVFMGMGEPLYNYKNVLNSIDNIMVDDIEGISRRKITLSTSGISPVLMKISKDLTCKLAISLHAPNNEIRDKIMPINKIYNIKSIMEACKEYTKYHEYLKITFEYLLLHDINDSIDCAYQLVDLLKNINAKVNLLQFNTWNGCIFEPSPKDKVISFSRILTKEGIESPIRTRRGVDIMAACGQLKSTNNIKINE